MPRRLSWKALMTGELGLFVLVHCAGALLFFDVLCEAQSCVVGERLYMRISVCHRFFLLLFCALPVCGVG